MTNQCSITDPVLANAQTKTIYIYTQSKDQHNEPGYHISNICLEEDMSSCFDDFTNNSVFIEVRKPMVPEIQANILRNILVSAGVDVVLSTF